LTDGFADLTGFDFALDLPRLSTVEPALSSVPNEVKALPFSFGVKLLKPSVSSVAFEMVVVVSNFSTNLDVSIKCLEMFK